MRVVHVFAKNTLQDVWTYLQSSKGQILSHIRVFATGQDGELLSTNLGITVALSGLSRLDEAIRALMAPVEARST
jgi:methylglyoxal synthase